ncbi:copper-binding protein [Actimicrobium sp. CCC2.4]|uniref:copper-binding protein n=1 Tax=Actimicrobium sp. CCC2.4 TaxID=3048606 RepID=UPI002AC8D5B1|nr:copper-binding protein [Actimicrobium sp. CCC2.4]MEB0137138.1 copper-binding protein [Actimicrobium sp. CCC2.4]WPX30926.1 copper-binding protein [Actimicrobium sp. CCC2.4]
MKPISLLAAALLMSLTVPFALAQTSTGASTTSATAAVAAKPTPDTNPMTQGEVQKIDKNTGRITIKHGPLLNLGMPGMTMVFRVKDPAMLDKVKPTDKIRFSAEKMNGALTVVAIETSLPK